MLQSDIYIPFREELDYSVVVVVFPVGSSKTRRQIIKKRIFQVYPGFAFTFTFAINTIL